jgi:hypothetical protein
MARKKSSTTKQTETQKASEETQQATEETKTGSEETTTTETQTEQTAQDNGSEETTPETETQTNDETQDNAQETQGGDTQGDAGAGDDTQATPDVEEEVEVGGLAGEVKDDGLRQIAYRFDQYVAAMDPKAPQTSQSIQKQQLKLRTVVNNILDLPDEKFADGMKMLIQGVRQNRKGAFSEAHLFRGFPELRIARAERQKLEQLLSLLLASADSKSPKKVTEVVDLNVLFRYLNSNDQQQKLQSFYGE